MARKKRARPSLWVILGMGLIAGVGVWLGFLLSPARRPAPPPQRAEAPVTADRPGDPAGDAARWMDERLQGLWAQLRIPPARVRRHAIPNRVWEGQQWEMRVLDVRLPAEISLARASAGVEHLPHDVGRSVQILWVMESSGLRAADIWVEGYLTHRLFLREAPEQPVEPVRPPVARGPQIALVVDDLGQVYSPVRPLLDLNVPLTLSVLPGLPYSQQIAAEAGTRGMEVMVHVPMEPWGYPEKRPGPGALMTSMTAEDLEEVLLAQLRQLPAAKGVNNHMGSRFTEDAERMGKVMRVLGSKGLFFVDSLTTPKSVGFHVAKRMGVRAYRRDVFLDAVQDEEKIRGQFSRLMQVARLQGYAIGICHPYPETLRVLPELVVKAKEKGYQWVTVSQLRIDGEPSQRAATR